LTSWIRKKQSFENNSGKPNQSGKKMANMHRSRDDNVREKWRQNCWARTSPAQTGFLPLSTSQRPMFTTFGHDTSIHVPSNTDG